MKRKLKIMSHQIDQNKDEIATKDKSLQDEIQMHHRVEKEKEHLKGWFSDQTLIIHSTLT